MVTRRLRLLVSAAGSLTCYPTFLQTHLRVDCSRICGFFLLQARRLLRTHFCGSYGRSLPTAFRAPTLGRASSRELVQRGPTEALSAKSRAGESAARNRSSQLLQLTNPPQEKKFFSSGPKTLPSRFSCAAVCSGQAVPEMPGSRAATAAVRSGSPPRAPSCRIS